MAKLRSNLTKIARQAPQSASRALVRTGRSVLNTASQLAPVDQGDLRESYLKPTALVELRAGDYQDTRVVHIGSDVEHSAYQEFGTSRMDAQPHFTPAFIQNVETFKKILAEEVKADL